MQKIKHLPLYFLSCSLCYISYSNAKTASNSNPPQIVGSITAAEIESKVIARNRLRADYSPQEEKRLLEVWKKYVPPYIRFMQTEAPINNTNVRYVQALNNKDLPSQQILPINGSVLDQGSYGTCSTFALMGAIEQSLLMNDTSINFDISPSCTLQMETSVKGGPTDVWNGS